MIVVITTIECRKESINFMKNELCKLVPFTIREQGCITYQFYQDRKKPNFFHSYEIWISQQDINNHLKTSYIQRYMQNTKDITTNFIIREMDKIC